MILTDDKIVERLNYQTNKYGLGGGKFAQQSCIGVINYKEDSKFKKIDTVLVDDGNFWSMKKSIYNIVIPKYADEWFEFRNVFEENNHVIKSRPVASHVLGVLNTETNTVIYTDAFGDGIDMEISIFNAVISRKIIVRKTQTKELNIDFEFDTPDELIIETKDKKCVKNNLKLDDSLKEKGILFNGERGSFISPMRIWDESEDVLDKKTGDVIKSKNSAEFIEAKFFIQNGKKYLRKTLSKEFLEKSVYPIYADDDTGATSPGTMANDATVGVTAWANPDNAKADDAYYATVILKAQASQYLKATNFGFSIPEGDEIDGILVNVKGKGVYTNLVDDNIRIVKGGSISATNLSVGTVWPTTIQTWAYGGATSLWGETWEYDDINSATFGFVLSVNWAGGTWNWGYVDHITITIYYTEVVPPSEIKSVNGVLLASVKEYDGLAIADVKSIVGVTNV